MFSNKKQNVKSFLKDYKVAAFASSSKFLIKEVLKEFEVSIEPQVIIEFGPGDGVLSKELLKKMKDKDRLILVEQNQDFLNIIRKIRDDRVQIYEGYAQDFPYERYLSKRKADYVFSSIPFSFLKPGERDLVIKKISQNLKPKGKLVIFHQYSLIMKDLVAKYFKNVRGKFEILNFLPCFIITSTQ
jgi:phospholipid N-methyltransferase